MHEISIWYNRKIELNIWYRNLCLQLQRSDVSFQVLGLLLGNTEFQLPPYIFYWVQVWRLARPLQDLEMLLMEPILSCPCCVFGVIVMLKLPATTHLQCSYWGKEVVGQNLAIHDPLHPPINTMESSCPLCWKAPPKHDVSAPMLHGWDGVLGIVLILLLPPNTASGIYTKKLYFCLIWPHDLLPCLLWIIQMYLALFRRAWTCAGLSRGTLCAAGF